jgi:uncharacterized protein (TIGR02598 family)
MRISGFRRLRRAVMARWYLFSANGASFIVSPPQDEFAVANLGQHPRENGRFKPLALCNLKSWGVAPGCDKSALSTPNRSAHLQYHRCDPMAAAFSLVELVLALGVAAFCLFAVFGLMPVGMQTNRNATSQTAATNIIAGIVADLRATPAAATSSPQFAVTFGTDKTLYFDASGQASTSLGTDSRYRLNITWNSAPTGLHYAALKVTWPAAADPAITIPSGSVEIFAAFDRS